MSHWKDLEHDEAGWRRELADALADFDWSTVNTLCDALVDRIDHNLEVMPTPVVQAILDALQRKRRFSNIRNVAGALRRRGHRAPVILRHEAQALIDQGQPLEADGYLQRVLRGASEEEQAEARGLLGRLHKQLYVTAALEGAPPDPHDLRASLRAYRTQLEQGFSIWHAINVVAVAARAKRDHVRVPRGTPDHQKLARTILRHVSKQRGRDPWALAVEVEAQVALGKADDAIAAARRYVEHPATDAFHLASTLRQLREVWVLDTYGGPFGALIALLDAALLKRSGGEVSLTTRKLVRGLERSFDDESLQSLSWFKLALQRCDAVARVETKGGRKVGSGFLVKPSDFFDPAPEGPMLLTNWHVISEGAQFEGSVAPEDAVVTFESSGLTCEVAELYAYNRALDAAFVLLKRPERDQVPCPLLVPTPAYQPTPRKRLYVIGHPAGGGLSFSLHDSVWIAGDGTRLHYRTPTLPGSSGSPVFEQSEWKVVALHHAGHEAMPRLTGAGTYEANEGIAIGAIKAAVGQRRKQ